MIKLISINQKEEWITYVKKSIQYDFYHTWCYHSLDKSGEPILFVYEEDDNYIAFPLLKREIPNSTFYDLSSVYGFAGPISNQKFENLPESLIESFKCSFLKFLEHEQIVSVFSRLHPFFNQLLLINKIGGVYENGKTVAIDLSIPIDEQRKKYKNSTLDYVKKCKKRGYYIKETKCNVDVEAFYKIYTENMKRSGSTDYYLFNHDYFHNLINSEEFDCRLLLVYADDEIICGSIITCTHGIIEAHLVATHYEYLRDSPAKFLIDEISVMGRELGMKYCHLGGGLGFKEDSLFKWKASFSDLFLDYKSLRYISNNSVYNSLVDDKGIDPNINIDFFPLYRCAMVS